MASFPRIFFPNLMSVSLAIMTLSASAFVLPASTLPRMQSMRATCLRMKEIEVVTRAQISARNADPQSGGGLAVYAFFRKKLVALYSAQADVDAILTAEQLTALMSSVGEDLSEDEIATMMSDAGTMNFARWAQMMMKGDPNAPPPEKKFFGLF